VVERPVYDLTVFKVHFGRLTLKIYSKGERVLRIEAIAHNTEDLRCGKRIAKFPDIVEALRAILERFLSVLRSVDISFIDAGTLEAWHTPSKLGSTRVAGVDVNQFRIRAVMKALVALSISIRGFAVSDLAAKVREILGVEETRYRSCQASYDLRKFRGKELVRRIGLSNRYEVSPSALRTMTAFLVLRDKVLTPLLANAGQRRRGARPKDYSPIDAQYDSLQIQMQKLFSLLGIAA
jgi:DNA-binding transcriptional ArsR family regulator